MDFSVSNETILALRSLENDWTYEWDNMLMGIYNLLPHRYDKIVSILENLLDILISLLNEEIMAESEIKTILLRAFLSFKDCKEGLTEEDIQMICFPYSITCLMKENKILWSKFLEIAEEDFISILHLSTCKSFIFCDEYNFDCDEDSFLRIVPDVSFYIRQIPLQSDLPKMTESHSAEALKGFLLTLKSCCSKRFIDTAADVFKVIDNLNRSNVEIQDELCQLVGYHKLDVVEMIIHDRYLISDSVNELLIYLTKFGPLSKKETLRKNFSFSTDNDKTYLSDHCRKFYKRLKKLFTKTFNEELLVEFAIRIMQTDVKALGAGVLSLKTSRTVGPSLSYTQNFDAYSAIIIPPEETIEVEYNDLIKVELLSDIERTIFSDITTLNIIQTRVYDTVVNTSENILICAPTGAGKTNIALLAIVREILRNSDTFEIKKGSFKVVYITPMKALASEITKKLTLALKPLRIKVKEVTGDIQPPMKEIMEANIIITTPEKWDVITRKPAQDISLPTLTRLLIIDEIHLLQDDRGPVIESIVARTLRFIETTQSMVRLVGLSATLPNYHDVASFLHVKVDVGLFYFDSKYRSVPLMQTFAGIKNVSEMMHVGVPNLDLVCFKMVVEALRQHHQVIIFVHSRNLTFKTAETLQEQLMQTTDSHLMNSYKPHINIQQIQNNKLSSLIENGYAVHHAGLSRRDRDVVEKNFLKGHIRVLVSTATLSWGVNLPAQTIIIKGTDIYNPAKGKFVQLSIQDVQQIFGRAGRPQFTKTEKGEYGHAVLLTSYKNLDFYVKSFTEPKPIESQLLKSSIIDVINAEIALGTITSIDEGIGWLKYTYFYHRVHKNPLAYGTTSEILTKRMHEYESSVIVASAEALDKIKMIRYDRNTSMLSSTNLGRIASNYYLNHITIGMIQQYFNSYADIEELFRLVAKSSEFQCIIVREDEVFEMTCLPPSIIRLGSFTPPINQEDKIFMLLQAYISQKQFCSYSLQSDMNYIAQNAGRISKALFEIAMYNDWASAALRMHSLSRSLNMQVWMNEHPLQQFAYHLKDFEHIMRNLQKNNMTIERIRDMNVAEVGSIIRNSSQAYQVCHIAGCFPYVCITASSRPITKSILSVVVTIKPDFVWDSKILGVEDLYYILIINDPLSDHIYYSETISLSKKKLSGDFTVTISTFIPLVEPVPPQYEVKLISENFVGADTSILVDLDYLVLPHHSTQHTNLLDLKPLSVSVLPEEYASLYTFSYFNPVQTQTFHSSYHTDSNIIIGAPTGSGKTIIAEFAMFRTFNIPGAKIVYIGPLKSLVHERYKDWKVRFGDILHKKIVELTGEVSHDYSSMIASEIILSTPEKWDGISRGWTSRAYVKEVQLIILDEVHLLGDERGHVLEAVVARLKNIEKKSGHKIRIIALSTATANAPDLARWLDVRENGLFNFRPSVRPIPLEVHISGFSENKYCPRMNMMNKPIYDAIRTHSSKQPVLIFSSSRRQTKRTAAALVNFISQEPFPKQWLRESEKVIDNVILTLSDEQLKLYLSFGIGIHHAGLEKHDRKVVQDLFLNKKIQILIATSTLAWGVNLPAHLVIIKGTEYFDAKVKRFVDFPITDLLQMMGRAGRPQFDTYGVAVILVQDIKKNFYKKFLYEPFPIESNFLAAITDHINAEICAGTIQGPQDAWTYLKRTYLYQRLLKNPHFYGFQSAEPEEVVNFIASKVKEVFENLLKSYCIKFTGTSLQDSGYVTKYEISSFGRLASIYYVSYKTIHMYCDSIKQDSHIEHLLDILCSSFEFAVFPVRHNEDILNKELSTLCPLNFTSYNQNNLGFEDPHKKVHLLLQCHYSGQPLPISDYVTDTRSLLDQSIRLFQSMIDVSALKSYLSVVIQVIILMQCTIFGCWWNDTTLKCLPYYEQEKFYNLTYENTKNKRENFLTHLHQLIGLRSSNIEYLKKSLLCAGIDRGKTEEITTAITVLPFVGMEVCVDADSELSDFVNISEIFESDPFLVKKKDSFVLGIKLLEQNKRRGKNVEVTGTKFPKSKVSSWFILVGDKLQNKLFAFRRVSFTTHTKVYMDIPLKNLKDKCCLSVYLMSDTYFGLDQQYSVPFTLYDE